jgi:Ca2+-binding RTX toxin-like protein
VDLTASTYVVDIANKLRLQLKTSTSGGVDSSGIEVVSGTELVDTITGNSNSNLLLGRAGNDSLLGGVGDDLVIGGDGADDLMGELGEDLLLAGSLDFEDREFEALMRIKEEWESGNTVKNRRSNLLGSSASNAQNDGYYLDSSSIDDDSAADDLDGGDPTIPDADAGDWLLFDDIEDIDVGGEQNDDILNY